MKNENYPSEVRALQFGPLLALQLTLLNAWLSTNKTKKYDINLYRDVLEAKLKKAQNWLGSD